MLTGADSSKEAIELCNAVARTLSESGLHLRKWVSNVPAVQELLEDVQFDEDCIQFGDKDQNKTLGLYWNFRQDHLRFQIDFPKTCVRNTKRTILSEISRIYDPLGLVGPAVLLAKVLLRKLWQEKLDWDESLPISLETEWRKLRNDFDCLNKLKICRRVVGQGPVKMELHGFADASQLAYGACVYVRCLNLDRSVSVNLLCSKVKVAPLKTQTIPRLELCGALVLAKLISKVKTSLSLEIKRIVLWTDSTVVLGWLGAEPSKLQVFVGNRVAQIQSLTNSGDWRHVRSEQNPADVLSRGVFPTRLVDIERWWKGSEFLQCEEVNWPKLVVTEDVDLLDLKSNVVTQVVREQFPFEKFSCLGRLNRAIAYCFRFVKREGASMPLLATELNFAMDAMVLMVQKESFWMEINNLKKGKHGPCKSIQGLSPFVDSKGFLRVGGRLQLSNLPYSTKHPILLSGKHRFSKLLLEMEHRRLLHCGPQMLLSSVRENFWILGGRNLARKVIRECVRCFKAKPVPFEQIMGVLPKDRVQPTPPFYVTGTDYAGPFLLKNKLGKKAHLSKCYICLFICFSTKVMHLEIVTDLSSEAFIACFRRFVSRRGKPFKIISDNGTNYIGANTELKELVKVVRADRTLGNFIGNEGVLWEFIPARAPHFGGLWEAGVRSCKHHLKRIMGMTPLTYEELSTLLAQIEAALNSRPLVPLSSNPNDFDVLTPSHFLIGRKLTSLPDPDVRHIPANRLSRWQHLQMLYQHFWNRWSSEYLAELQKKTKWTQERKNLDIGQLVIIQEDNLPPLHWKLGRILEKFSGPDGNVRVVTVKTVNGDYKRPVTKLCPLPFDS